MAWTSPATLKGKYLVALTFASGEVVLTMMERKVLEPVGYDFSGILI